MEGGVIAERSGGGAKKADSLNETLWSSSYIQMHTDPYRTERLFPETSTKLYVHEFDFWARLSGFFL